MRDVENFLSGIAIGMFLFAILMIVFGLSPKSMNDEHWRKEIIKRGYGEMVRVQDDDFNFSLEFKWKDEVDSK